MLENFHYFGHFKGGNRTVPVPPVLHSEKKQFRLSGDELKRFNEHKLYSKSDESKFIKQLIKEALDKRESDNWREEVSEW